MKGVLSQPSMVNYNQDHSRINRTMQDADTPRSGKKSGMQQKSAMPTPLTLNTPAGA